MLRRRCAPWCWWGAAGHVPARAIFAGAGMLLVVCAVAGHRRFPILTNGGFAHDERCCGTLSPPTAPMGQDPPVLAAFRPTKVAVEAPWDDPAATSRYHGYRAGTVPPRRSEVEQIGFRVAAPGR